MIERPPLPDDLLITTLKVHYNLTVTGLQFLPVGNDAATWAFKADSKTGQNYFIKIKKGAIYTPGVEIPYTLQVQGLPQVLAPIPSQGGDLWVNLGGFNLILYPFITGETGGKAGMSDSQWTEFGHTLRTTHTISLEADLAAKVQTESFQPYWGPMVLTLDNLIQEAGFSRACEIELANFWQVRRDEIFHILARTEELGRYLKGKALDFVLCHADIHPFNILLDQDGDMFIIDWDGLVYAPKERDLMFIGDPALDKTREVKAFYAGYGTSRVDPFAQAYYHYEWVVQEIGDFGERVFLMKDIGSATRQHALQGFINLFQPGDVVDAAYQSAAHLPPSFFT